MTGRPRIKPLGLEPEVVYAELGPLSVEEVLRLHQMRHMLARKRYLSTIYGMATLPYAYKQYQTLAGRLVGNVTEEEFVADRRVYNGKAKV